MKNKEEELYKEAKPYVGDDSLFDGIEESEIDFSLLDKDDHRFSVVRIPTGIEVLKLMSQLEISMTWRNSGHRFTLMFGFMWNAILSIFVLTSLGAPGGFGIFPFLLPFLGVGAWLMYDGLAKLLNTCYIRIRKGKIHIENRPINFWKFKDREYDLSDIKQFYVKKYKAGSKNDQAVYAFGVFMRLNSGEDVALLKELRTPEYGHYLEHQIETYIGMQDTPIRGELKAK